LLNLILIKEGLEFYSIRTSYLFWSIKENGLVWRIVKYANENMSRFWSIGENRGEWKIKHYVLSMTVRMKWNAVIKIKAPIEDKLISGYNKTIDS
jgi:hypothetical protein